MSEAKRKEHSFITQSRVMKWYHARCEFHNIANHHLVKMRKCACGSVSKWSWGRVGGLCACAEAPGVVCEAKKVLDA